jgi:hypothetical protein
VVSYLLPMLTTPVSNGHSRKRARTIAGDKGD